MAKRGYKLQEFVAHTGNVNCLTFGKKNCQVFITGGDDQKVNLWSVGKPTSLMSLCGHTSPVESASFDSAEVLVVAGSSSGAIKLWDMKETKLVRTLTGHRSYCTAVEFHPFGEFFASGSMDTNLKLWDIRKKGCIHTYKGHARRISTIRFSPDGRWVVSGGFDNVVKVWDLTAGKLLHDFKFHEGHVRSIEFHPLEFLLATGSADKTVKFWDLETFEMIGSARREATGVRSMTFHPDGRNLFCGLDDSVKIYSWEPVICHDSVDMGWLTLGDLCINDGKLLGGAYYKNSVAVWVADVSLMEPYGSKLPPEKHIHSEQKIDSEGSLLKKEESHVKSKSNLRSTTPDSDSNDIKIIYVDRVSFISSNKVEPLDAPKVILPPDSKESSNAGIQKLDPAINLRSIKSVTSKTVDPPETPKVALTSDSKEISTVGIQKSGLAMSLPTKTNVRAGNRSLVMPNIIPHDGPDGKKSVGSRRDSMGPPKTSSGVSAKSHARRLSSSPFEMGRMSISLDSVPCDNLRSPLGGRKDSNPPSRHVEENAKEFSEGNEPSIKTVSEKFDRASSLETVPSTGSFDQTESSSKGVKRVRVVNGVTVVHGRTRSLVERFEKREMTDVDETNTPARSSGVTSEPLEIPSSQVDETEPRARASRVTSEPVETPLSRVDETVTRARASCVTSEPMETPPSQVAETIPQSRASRVNFEPVETPLSQVDETVTRARASRVTSEPVETPPSQVAETIPRAKASRVTSEPVETPLSRVDETVSRSRASRVTSETVETPLYQVAQTVTRARASRVTAEPVETPPSQVAETIPRARASRMTADPVKIPPSRVDETVTRARASRMTSEHVETPLFRIDETVRQARASRVTTEPEEIPAPQSGGQPIIMREEPTMGDDNIIENLMQNHDMLLSTFRSRLTKLQVVRHFWERNDIKGAIGAVRKLPDRAVQADVVGVLVDRMEIITLDLFSCLLPMLLGLLDGKVERHSTVSLEMLLKMVAVFGTVIRSTVSAPPAVGVDLHLEERRECCRQCFAHLQNIQKIIPELVRRGGNVARCAQQLNLILQQS